MVVAAFVGGVAVGGSCEEEAAGCEDGFGDVGLCTAAGAVGSWIVDLVSVWVCPFVASSFVLVDLRLVVVVVLVVVGLVLANVGYKPNFQKKEGFVNSFKFYVVSLTFKEI